jgi:bacteriocin-like protein
MSKNKQQRKHNPPVMLKTDTALAGNKGAELSEKELQEVTGGSLGLRKSSGGSASGAFFLQFDFRTR